MLKEKGSPVLPSVGSKVRYHRRLHPPTPCHVTCNGIGYTLDMAIKSFRHKGLERFFATGTKSGIQVKHVDRLRLILGRLNVASEPRDMNLPGLELHPLRGARKGTWAVKASGNWRITFSCSGKDVNDVNYEDYH